MPRRRKAGLTGRKIGRRSPRTNASARKARRLGARRARASRRADATTGGAGGAITGAAGGTARVGPRRGRSRLAHADSVFRAGRRRVTAAGRVEAPDVGRAAANARIATHERLVGRPHGFAHSDRGRAEPHVPTWALRHPHRRVGGAAGGRARRRRRRRRHRRRWRLALGRLRRAITRTRGQGTREYEQAPMHVLRADHITSPPSTSTGRPFK